MEMSTFIAEMIMAQADISLEAGQAKYRAYFINTKLYLTWQANANTILQTTDTTIYPNGYGAVIVSQ